MELVLEGFPQQSSIRAFWRGIGVLSSRKPATFGRTTKEGAFPTGFQYASLLIGRAGQHCQFPAITDSRLGNHSIGVFLQDNWKVTHKLTLDYGLRWDYASLLTEQYGRMQNADFTDVNPALGLPGSIQYGATCKCNFNQNYPFSIGPRLGVAYQLTPKTVIRIGAGISYSSSPNNAFLSYSVPNFQRRQPGWLWQRGDATLAGKSVRRSADHHVSVVHFSSRIRSRPLVAARPVRRPALRLPLRSSRSIKCTGRLPRIFQWSIGILRRQ